MILRDLILRVRAKCPVFENRVFGSAQLEEGIRQAEGLTVPAAFVMVDGDFPEGNVDASMATQQTQERWTIVVVVSNRDDDRGQSASDKLHTVRRQLMAALLGWENYRDEDEDGTTEYETDWGPIIYRGSLHIDMNAARLWHQFSFGHTIILSTGGREYEAIPEQSPRVRGGPQPIEGLDGLTAEDFMAFEPGSTAQPVPKPPHRNPRRGE